MLVDMCTKACPILSSQYANFRVVFLWNQYCFKKYEIPVYFHMKWHFFFDRSSYFLSLSLSSSNTRAKRHLKQKPFKNILFYNTWISTKKNLVIWNKMGHASTKNLMLMIFMTCFSLKSRNREKNKAKNIGFGSSLPLHFVLAFACTAA